MWLQLSHQEDWADRRAWGREVAGVQRHGGDGGGERCDAFATAILAGSVLGAEKVCSVAQHSNSSWTRLSWFAGICEVLDCTIFVKSEAWPF